MNKRKSIYALAVLLLCTVGSSHAAPPLAEALGDGALYEIHAGTVGDLFGTHESIPMRTPVLALDVADATGVSRTLVPGTETLARDGAPVLLIDAVGDGVNVVWQSWLAGRLDRVQIARFSQGTWSDVYTVLEGGASRELALSRALTRERSVLTLPDAQTVTIERTILHLLMREEAGPASTVAYTPLVFADGAFVGQHETYSLLDLFAPTAALQGFPTDGLRTALAFESTADRTLVAAFLDPRSNQLVSVEIDVLPIELSSLAHEVRRLVLDGFGGLEASTALANGGIRIQIIHGGAGLGIETTLVDYIAETAVAWSEAWFGRFPDGSVESYADALWHFIVSLTSAILASDPNGGGQSFEINLDPDNGQPSQVLNLRVVEALPTPEVGDGRTRIYTSANGHQLLVAWLDAADGTARWVESTGLVEAPWSDAYALVVQPRITLERANALLRARVRN